MSVLIVSDPNISASIFRPYGVLYGDAETFAKSFNVTDETKRLAHRLSKISEECVTRIVNYAIRSTNFNIRKLIRKIKKDILHLNQQEFNIQHS
jgi:hypothetical protein